MNNLNISTLDVLTFNSINSISKFFSFQKKTTDLKFLTDSLNFFLNRQFYFNNFTLGSVSNFFKLNQASFNNFESAHNTFNFSKINLLYSSNFENTKNNLKLLNTKLLINSDLTLKTNPTSFFSNNDFLLLSTIYLNNTNYFNYLTTNFNFVNLNKINFNFANKKIIYYVSFLN